MTNARIALVGLGGIAQAVHLPVIQRHRRHVDLAALVEISPLRLKTLGERFGVPPQHRFASVCELLGAIDTGALSVDGAIVASAGSHVDDAAALVGHDIRVLVEKPLAYSHSELDRLDHSIRSHGRDPEKWIRVGYMKEYDPAVAHAKNALAQGAARFVGIEVLHPADAHQLAFAHLEPPSEDVDPHLIAQLSDTCRRAVRDALGDVADHPDLSRLYTNVVLGSVIHDIALVRHLGVPLTHVASARRSADEFPGSLTAHGQSAAGMPWHLSWHFISDYPEYRETIRIHHESGTIALTFATPYILQAPTTVDIATGGPDLRSTITSTQWPQDDAFDTEFEALIQATHTEFPPGSGPQAARDDLLVAQALWGACATSAGVAIDPASEVARLGSPAS